MPTYTVKITNEHFSDSVEQEAPNAMKAWQKAIASTISIASDHVSHGNPFFGAVITLEEEGKQVGRYVVSVGMTKLTG